MMLFAATPERARISGLCAGLVAVNIAAWGWAWAAFGDNPVLLATGLLAYSFGLRHAVDADHIAAIDNATRKLIELGRSAATTGLFFSLGHAAVVVLASLGIALLAQQVQSALAQLQSLASAVATGFSALCLFALAIANAAVLVSVLRLTAAARRGEPPGESELRRLLGQRGLLGRMLRGVFALVSKSWHMFPVGFLFGLGFDTATEIGVLGVSAAQASHGLPLAAIMVFPALFTAGMALVDTLDAVMMAGVYRWASVEPLRKLYYNLAITAISVVVAVAIGGIEILGLYGERVGRSGALWRIVGDLNDHMVAIGAAIIALFALTWLTAAIVSRRRSLPSD